MSGIDIAFWDIKGKALGLPVLEAAWRRLSSEDPRPTRARFRAHTASTGDIGKRLVDQGFTAVKFGWDPMGQDRETDRALVREARRDSGPNPTC